MSIYSWEDPSPGVDTFFDGAGMLLGSYVQLIPPPEMMLPGMTKIDISKTFEIFKSLCMTSDLDNEDEFGKVYLEALEAAGQVPDEMVKDVFIEVSAGFRRAFSSNKVLKADYDGGMKQQVTDILDAFTEALDAIKGISFGDFEEDDNPGLKKFQEIIKEKMGLEPPRYD